MEQIGKQKILLIVLAVFLSLSVLFGLGWFFTGASSAPVGVGWYLFSFAAGLTMIVLPCTLPLAFIIVPLSMGKGPIKGFLIALSFGAGVTLMLSTYGILAAVIGAFALETLKAPLEVVKNWFYFIAGTFAYLFALGELGFINFHMPTYTGAAPSFINKQKDYLQAFLMGLFLGNIGVGCPHPATPVILTRIAVSGNVFYGWLLFFVHAVGRVIPLLLLAILGILGVNALSWIVERKGQLEKLTAWGMVYVAAFILVLGLFTHDWWVYSGQHTILEAITQEEAFVGIVASKLETSAPHHHGIPTGTGLFGMPLAWGNWVLVLLILIPLWWSFSKKIRKNATQSSDEKNIERKIMPHRLGFLLSYSLLLIVFITYIFPDRFLNHAMHTDEEGMAHTGASMPQGQMGHMDALFHEENEVQEGLVVQFSQIPPETVTGQMTIFNFQALERPQNLPVVNLEYNHDKLMHVIGVRNDLSEFFHVHPVSFDIAGLFQVNHTFAKPGLYKLWSEVKRGGQNHAFGHQPFSVVGQGVDFEKEVTFSNSVVTAGYQVFMEYDSPLVKDKSTHLSFDIHDGLGKEVEVEPYLAADMHLSIIKDDLTEFIHTHPDDHGSMNHSNNFLRNVVLAHGGEADTQESKSVADEHIDFTTVFPKEGIYKVFAQFRPQGIGLPQDEALLASFWVEVKEKGTSISSWWLLLFSSVAAIIALSFATRAFLNVKKKE